MKEKEIVINFSMFSCFPL